MATYNGGTYLQEQLESIYSQTYRNIEVVVTDDGSNDETIKILESYSKSHGLIFYINEKKLGFKKNFAKAMSYCSGSYVALADQDDIWLPHKLQTLIDNLECYDLVCSNMTLIDGDGRVIKREWLSEINLKTQADIFAYLMFGNFATGCTILMRKSLFDEFSPIPETEKYHDWWFTVCASQRNGVKFINEPLVLYRQHDKQDTGAGYGARGNKVVYTLLTIFSRLLGKESERVSFAKAQKKRLQGILASGRFYRHSEVVRHAYLYFDDYYRSFFHLTSFIISFKYAHIRYRKNYFCYKNFKNDLLG